MIFEHYFTQLNAFFEAHVYWAEAAAFIIALAESLPLIGTIVPGSLTMTLLGIFIGRGTIPVSTTLLFATLGAVLGDILGFWVGKHYNDGLRKIWPFRKYPHWLSAGEKFFTSHGGKSILIGRFVGPVRSTVPLIAGLLKFTWGRFLVAAIPAAFLWAVAYLIPGVLIGTISLELPKGKTFEFTMIALGVIVSLWVIFWLIQRFFYLIAFYINKGVDKVWVWFNEHHNSRFLIRMITNQDDPLDHHQLTMALLSFVFAILFLFVFVNVVLHTSFLALNQPLFSLLQSLRTAHADDVFVCLAILGENYIILPLTFLIAVYFGLQKNWRACLHVLALMFLTAGAIGFFKHLIYSPRPLGLMIYDTSSSFPSGHTALAVSIFGFLGFYCAQCLDKKWRWIPYVLAGGLMTLVAFSRIYLGAHWLTDVLGSILLGAAILLAIIVSYRRHPKNYPCKKSSLLVIPLILGLGWLIAAYVMLPTQRFMYSPYFPQKIISIDEWWQHPTYYLPIYRLNRFGKPIQPFNVQWSGELPEIEALFLSNGWHVALKKNTLKNTIQQLATKNPTHHVALLQPLYQNQAPALTLYYQLKDGTTIELRLWQSGVTFTDSTASLWIGCANFRRNSQKYLQISSQKQVTLADGGGLWQLSQALKNWHWRVLETPTSDQPKAIHDLQWNGKVLVVRTPSSP